MKQLLIACALASTLSSCSIGSGVSAYALLARHTDSISEVCQKEIIKCTKQEILRELDERRALAQSKQQKKPTSQAEEVCA